VIASPSLGTATFSSTASPEEAGLAPSLLDASSKRVATFPELSVKRWVASSLPNASDALGGALIRAISASLMKAYELPSNCLLRIYRIGLKVTRFQLKREGIVST